ncbi:MAG: 5'-3' exonuclease [Enterobacteriaceae bacterium]
MKNKCFSSPFILIDGFFVLYRSYYSFPKLKNKKGEYIGAIYGTIRIIKKLINMYCPTHMVVVFDSKGKTFRNKIFNEYKSNRPPMPKELKNQILPLCKIIKNMGIQFISVSGVEADDVIGTLSLEAEKNKKKVLIGTGDKDITQLVSSYVNMIDVFSNNITGPKEVKLKFGVPPKLIADYLALVGDNADNVPGVPGIGKKTAVILLEKIGNIFTLYKSLEKISILKIKNQKTIIFNLKQYKEIAFLSYKLTKIKTDVNINKKYCQFKIKKYL